MRVAWLVFAALVIMTAGPEAQPARAPAPETFTADAQVKGPAGAATATIQIHIQRYTPELNRIAVESALKYGGYPGFLTALRKAPDVGYVAHGDQKYTIRWARERATPEGRSIVLVTDKPVFFVGGGATEAKPREGYHVAVIQLDVDEAGVGSGTMAAAARVKPGAETGVQLDDYADEPVKLTVTRK